MSILIKTNSRISLTASNETFLTFTIDDRRRLTFDAKTPQMHELLLVFLKSGTPLSALKDKNITNSTLASLINNLQKNGLVEYHFQFTDCENAIVYPKSHKFYESFLSTASLDFKKSKYLLSRFSFFRREEDRLVFESPLATFQTVLNPPFLHRFLRFLDNEEDILDADCNTLQKDTWKVFIKLLINGHFIHLVNEIESKHLQFWEFHDLLFHSNSRLGNYDDNVRFGATYRFRQKHLTQPRTLNDRHVDCEVIPLYKPSLNDLEDNDKPFSQVLENRKSLRSHSKTKNLNIKELGEFLYRSIGIREIVKTPKQDAIFRPYPGAGAIHEIDFYLLVNSCEGLASGVYYYQPLEHALSRKNVNRHHIEKMIFNAKSAMGLDVSDPDPHILFTLTSRFDKMAWKYEKISYRCTLISIGAIFQTMSLVATRMDLASCIIGAGNSSLFGEALNISSLEEGAVAEFALGVPCNQDAQSVSH